MSQNRCTACGHALIDHMNWGYCRAVVNGLECKCHAFRTDGPPQP